MAIVLGLDLGTTSLSATAIDAAGRIVHTVERTHAADVAGHSPDCAEQNPRRILDVSLALLRELADRLPEAPLGLGLTGQMHGMLLTDAEAQPLSNLITWQDRRSLLAMPGTDHRYHDELLHRCAEDDLQRTGCRIAPGYLGTTLFTLNERGEIPPFARTAVLLADWIAAILTNGLLGTDRSNAASTGLYDVERDCWSAPLIAAAGFPRRLLPEVRNGVVIGGLTPEFAARTGLPAGLPVTNAIGDNQASVIGSVPAGTPSLQVTIGTGGQINWPVESFVRVPGMETRPLPDGRFLLVGAGIVGGATYAWVNDVVRSWLSAFGVEFTREAAYLRLNELLAAMDESGTSLACAPFFRGTRQEPQRRGAFTNVGVENFSPGDVAHAVLRGMAEAFHDVWTAAGSHRPAGVTRIVGTGNGLRKNPVLVRLLARTFGLPVFLPAHSESAACGAALQAGVTLGLWPDLAFAGENLLAAATVVPPPVRDGRATAFTRF